jgi:hypothetical protein
MSGPSGGADASAEATSQEESPAQEVEVELALSLRESGDGSAFVALMSKYTPILATFLGRLFGGPIGELWPVFVDRLRDRSYAIRDPENFHLWAMGIGAALWREEERQKMPLQEGPLAQVALSRIAPSLRPVFVMVHYCGLTIDQAAHALRIPRATALTRLHDAFTSLVAQLAPPPPAPPEDIPAKEMSAIPEASQETPIVPEPLRRALEESPEASPKGETPLVGGAVEVVSAPAPEAPSSEKTAGEVAPPGAEARAEAKEAVLSLGEGAGQAAPKAETGAEAAPETQASPALSREEEDIAALGAAPGLGLGAVPVESGAVQGDRPSPPKPAGAEVSHAVAAELPRPASEERSLSFVLPKLADLAPSGAAREGQEETQPPGEETGR